MWETLLGYWQTWWGQTLVFGLLVLWPLWVALRRAGLRPWAALAVFVPVVGLELVLVYALVARWPALAARREARR